MMPESTENLHIVTYDPKKSLIKRLIILGVFVVAIISSFFYGKWYSGYANFSSVDERDELLILSKQQSKEITELRKNLATAKASKQIDSKSTKDLQQNIKDLTAKLSQAENELSFYKRVMKPTDDTKGLRLQTWQLTPTEKKGTYDFELVISQDSQTNYRMEGRALVNIIGKRGQTKVALPLKDVSPEVSDSSIKFGFKFFQRVKGQIILPANFTAEKVEIILQSTGSRAARIQKVFAWTR